MSKSVLMDNLFIFTTSCCHAENEIMNLLSMRLAENEVMEKNE